MRDRYTLSANVRGRYLAICVLGKVLLGALSEHNRMQERTINCVWDRVGGRERRITRGSGVGVAGSQALAACLITLRSSFNFLLP